MGIFKNVSSAFLEFYDTDEITDMIIKRDYFNSTAFSGAYPIMKRKYRIWSVMLMIMHITVNIFHIVLIIQTLPVFYALNFTLLTYLVQIYLLIQFCLLFSASFNLKRASFRILHKEMIGLIYSYGEEIMDIVDDLKEELWKEKKKLFSLPIMLTLVGGNCIIVGPVLDSNYGSLGFNVSETPLYMEAPIPGCYPFDTSPPYMFYVLTFLQVLTAIFVVSSIGSGALVFINVLQYFELHQKYLLVAIEKIERRAEGLFVKEYGSRVWNGITTNLYDDARYRECYEKCLKKCFRHHQHLVRWFDSLQDLLSIPLGISYATGTIVIALSLLSVKTGTSLPGTAITSFMMCILEVCFMALLSVLGQRVADLSEDLRMAMYNIKWYLCTESTKLSIQIFQEMSLRTMQLTGFGLVKANLDTFSNVMNSAYSYYNLIMAV